MSIEATLSQKLDCRVISMPSSTKLKRNRVDDLNLGNCRNNRQVSALGGANFFF